MRGSGGLREREREGGERKEREKGSLRGSGGLRERDRERGSEREAERGEKWIHTITSS